MKITVAIDSLKGSLASMEAGNAAKGGILRVYPRGRGLSCALWQMAAREPWMP